MRQKCNVSFCSHFYCTGLQETAGALWKITTRWQNIVILKIHNQLVTALWELGVQPLFCSMLCVDCSTAWWKCWAKDSGVNLSKGRFRPFCTGLGSFFRGEARELLRRPWCFRFDSMNSDFSWWAKGGGTRAMRVSTEDFNVSFCRRCFGLCK